jgi:hypothetical protein
VPAEDSIHGHVSLNMRLLRTRLKGDDILHWAVLLFATPVSSLLTLFSSGKNEGGWAFILKNA